MDDIEYEDQLEEINLKDPVEVQSYKYSCDMDMKDIPKPLPCGIFRMGIIGRSGSGKSNLVQSLTQATGKKKIYNRQFSNVFIISPSIRSQANRPKLPSNRFYTSLKDLPEIINRLQTEDDLEGRTLLILDDLGSEIKREGKDMVYLKQIFNNGRHIGRPIINDETGEIEEPGAISVMITAQKLTQLAPYIRAQLTHLCLFDCRNTKTELQTLYEEFFHVNKDIFNEMLHRVFSVPYNFIFMDTQKSQIYNGFKSRFNIKNKVYL